MPGLCRGVRERLPAVHGGSAGRSTRAVVRRHLARCAECRAEDEREQAVAQGLAALQTDDDVTPPPGLLDDLLQITADPGLRGRAAVPARGAVSGARPGLSVAFLVAGAAAGTGLGWSAWRTGRAVRRRLRR